MIHVLNRWSICDTTAALQATNSKPFHQCPETKRIVAAGPHTKNKPTIGRNEQRAVTRPHRIGEGRPSAQKARLIRIPCEAPTARHPYTLATIELLTPVNKRSNCSALRGKNAASCRFNDSPSRNKKNRVKNVMSASTKNETMSLRKCVPQETNEWLICSSERTNAPRISSFERST